MRLTFDDHVDANTYFADEYPSARILTRAALVLSSRAYPYDVFAVNDLRYAVMRDGDTIRLVLIE
jgi:hypothetical protein